MFITLRCQLLYAYVTSRCGGEKKNHHTPIITKTQLLKWPTWCNPSPYVYFCGECYTIISVQTFVGIQHISSVSQLNPKICMLSFLGGGWKWRIFRLDFGLELKGFVNCRRVLLFCSWTCVFGKSQHFTLFYENITVIVNFFPDFNLSSQLNETSVFIRLT